jgi:tryptophanyl-tRNA synthetase
MTLPDLDADNHPDNPAAQPDAGVRARPGTGRPRVLSGHRPTGRLHLGHLVGALGNWVQMQDDFECFFTIVDWHALTTHYADTASLASNVREVMLDWLAAGLDPERSTLFVQSAVKQHAELHVILSMLTPIPWLERVPTYKEQQQQLQDRELNTYGFLGYPVLQAADILVYNADVVPVGEDQQSHVELTREIARRFNHIYKPVFKEPQVRLTRTPRLPGTDGRKMSKSYGNAIYLADTEEAVWPKLKTMLTDPARKRRHDPGNPDICPVFDFHKVFSNPDEISRVDRECRTAEIGCIDCKKILNVNLKGTMDPHRERRAAAERNPGQVRDILEDGAVRARKAASAVMDQVNGAIGIGSLAPEEGS